MLVCSRYASVSHFSSFIQAKKSETQTDEEYLKMFISLKSIFKKCTKQALPLRKTTAKMQKICKKPRQKNNLKWREALLF